MALNLYHVTVQIPGAINACEICTFRSDQEFLVLARGQWLEVLAIEEDEAVLKSRTNMFASIRCIQRVAMQGSAPDALALTSDSGDFVLLTFDAKTARFSELTSEIVGRSGFRRTIPGEYLAVDPKGRVALVAAIERLRTAYVLHPDGVSSVVEAPAPSTFCYNMVAMDRGYGNPAFASLERFRFGPKQVVMYEFNLGLNHLVKTWSHTVPDNTDVLSPVPGGRDGPSGVIVYPGSTAVYLDPATGEARHELALTHPVRCARTVRVRRDEFFVLVQSVDGTCFKLALTDDGLVCHDFDSLPHALDFQVLKSGHVFVNCEAGDHVLTQISSLSPPQWGERNSIYAISPCISSTLQRKQLVMINHCGKQSRLSLVEYGREIEELVSSPLPGVPSAVYASKRSLDDAGHRLIALTFENTTTFLSVADDGSVNEASEAETGLASKVHTLGLHYLSDGALVQVHPSGFRYVSEGQTIPWLAPKGSTITRCAFTATQVLLALDGRQVFYFEARDGTLVESKQRINLPSVPTAVCFEPPLANELSSTTFYVSCDDDSVRAFAVVGLKQQKLFNAPSPVTSMLHKNTLHLGHMNGTYSALHGNQFWTKVLGSDPVRLVSLEGDKILALTTRSWVLAGITASPLASSAPSFVAAHSFVTEDLPDGILGISGPSLLVFTVPLVESGTKASMREVASLPSPVSRMARNLRSNFLYACGSDSLFVVDNKLDGAASISFSQHIGLPTVACSNVRFDSQKKETLVLATESSIQTYEYTGLPPGSEVLLLHTTTINRCTALLPFKGMLLAAVQGTKLVLYDLGRKQLLRKAAIDLPELVTIKVLRASRDRIFVGDSRRSVTVLSYHESEFSVVCADPIPRSVTAMIVLDHATVCIGDQYGNIAILRCRTDTPAQAVGSSLDLVAHFRVCDGIVDLHKGALSPVAGVDAIVYSGIQGTIGALIPLTSKEDQLFFSEVASEINRRAASLAGRDGLAFRGYYTPPKNVVDGDLCESAVSGNQELDSSELQEVAHSMDMNLDELIFRVLNYRDRSVF